MLIQIISGYSNAAGRGVEAKSRVEQVVSIKCRGALSQRYCTKDLWLVDIHLINRSNVFIKNNFMTLNVRFVMP